MGIAVSVAAAITPMKFHADLPRSREAQPRDTSRPQGHAETHGSSEDVGWLITLSDLTLLLLCFLGLWYVKNQEHNAPAQAAKPATLAAPAAGGSGNTLPAGAHTADWNAIRDEIDDFIAGAGMSDDVSIAAASDEIIISFKDTVPFASGKTFLRPEALPVLEKVAAVAVSRPAMRLEVNGHTDDRPISTVEFPSNWELSSARASRVARYLVEKGVHPARIVVHGFAYHRPRIANENRRSRGANRRVELRLMRSDDAVARQSSEVPTR
jgi:chemotaxis protein MotB